MYKWFTYHWYKYLFEKPINVITFICRLKGHPNGIIYFNPSGFEPNYQCKDCGDEL